MARSDVELPWAVAGPGMRSTASSIAASGAETPALPHPNAAAPGRSIAVLRVDPRLRVRWLRMTAPAIGERASPVQAGPSPRVARFIERPRASQRQIRIQPPVNSRDKYAD